jgi:hypothetical protein
LLIVLVIVNILSLLENLAKDAPDVLCPCAAQILNTAISFSDFAFPSIVEKAVAAAIGIVDELDATETLSHFEDLLSHYDNSAVAVASAVAPRSSETASRSPPRPKAPSSSPAFARYPAS